jgi:hypothetical protein
MVKSIIFNSPNYADPDQDLVINADWQVSNTTPSTGNSLASKSYVDSTAGSGVLTMWNNTRTYAVGDMVASGNSLWVCRVAGSNQIPSLATNNWRRLADLDTSNQSLYVQPVTANYTWPREVFAIRADTSSGNITVTLGTVASYANSDTSNRLRTFWALKDSNANTLTIQLSGSDTFPDGSTSLVLRNGGVSAFFYADFASNKWRT